MGAHVHHRQSTGLAAAFVIGVVLLTQAPARASTCVTGNAVGYVRDPFGHGIAGASVNWVDDHPDAPGCYGSAVTDSVGKYVLRSKFPGGGPARVHKTGFNDAVHNVVVLLGTVPDARNDFVLLHELAGALTPETVTSGQEILILAWSTAPAPPSNPSARLIAQLPNGTRRNLTQGETDPDGWTAWTGSHWTSAGDGTFTIKVCGVKATWLTGNCDAAQSTVPPQTVTPVGSMTYKVDDTPPSMVGQTPGPGRDWLDRRPTIEVAISDGSGSGVNVNSLSLRLDGSLVAASYSSGILSFRPSSDLALGLHTVTSTAADLLGNNAAPYSFTFDTVQLITTGTTASIPTRTVSVNPNNAAIPPNKVTFVAPPLTRGSFQATLSSSLEQGYGTLDSVPVLTSATVTFNNETGIPRTVSAGLVNYTVADHVANLRSTRDLVGVTFGERTVGMPNLTVNVPAGYGTRGSTATLVMNAVSIVPRAHSSGPALGTDIPEQPWQLVGWHLTARAVQVNGSTDITAGTYPIVRMKCAPNQNCPVVIEPAVLGSKQTPQPYGQDLPPDLDPAAAPNTVNGCAAGYSCVQVNGTQPTSTFWSVPGIIAAAGYHRFYSIAPSGGSPNRYVAWQQSYIDLDPVSCGSLLLQTFGNTTRSLTSAWAPQVSSPGFAATLGLNGKEFTDVDPGPAAWLSNYYVGSPTQHRGKEVVYLGRTGYRIGSRANLSGDVTAGVDAQLQQRADGIFVLTGDLTGAVGSRIDELGQIVAESRGSYNLWTAKTAGYDRAAVVHTGTEYVGSTNSSTFESGISFTMLLDTTGC